VYNSSILLVDDETAILQLLETVLRKEGFLHIEKATNAEMALSLCQQKSFNIILLDIMMPQMSGIEICPLIRKLTDAPILFLSARSSDFDKLSGFAVGGDDYVTKPFNPLEVIARIKSLLRRSSHQDHSTKAVIYDYDYFQVNETSAELIVNGESVQCPSLVFQLLLFFCKHPNRVFTKGELYERVWGENSISDDNTIMVHIRRIRERIEPNPSNPTYLINVRGLGYKLIQNKE